VVAKAFQAAVMQWRQGGSAKKEEVVDEPVNDGMWKNPFAVEEHYSSQHNEGESLAIGALDEEKERKV
jgi:hypothetical protein